MAPDSLSDGRDQRRGQVAPTAVLAVRQAAALAARQSIGLAAIRCLRTADLAGTLAERWAVGLAVEPAFFAGRSAVAMAALRVAEPAVDTSG